LEIFHVNATIVFMELLHYLIDFILHLEHHLTTLIEHYGSWTYLILFLIIFCETGLVVTPFLPGDSLLFALGALAAKGSLDVSWLAVLLSVAAISGNVVNYSIGRWLSPKVKRQQKIKFIKQEYIDRTEKFFHKYGGKTIIITRFVPIIRTFAPFMAGVGNMNYGKFLIYNVVGGLLWVNLLVWAGYFFGTLPIVEKNFEVVVLAIIVISLVPVVYELIQAKRHTK
jgi:membrane-associated protein